jgi:hypothetical protein
MMEDEVVHDRLAFNRIEAKRPVNSVALPNNLIEMIVEIGYAILRVVTSKGQ